MRRLRVATAAAAERRATARLRWFASGRFACLAHMTAALRRWELVAAAKCAARLRRLRHHSAPTPRHDMTELAKGTEVAEAADAAEVVDARGQPQSEASRDTSEVRAAGAASTVEAEAEAEAEATASASARHGAPLTPRAPHASPTPTAISPIRSPGRCHAVRFAPGSAVAGGVAGTATRSATVTATAMATQRQEARLRKARWDLWRCLLRWRRRHRKHVTYSEKLRRLRAPPPKYLGRTGGEQLRAKAAIRAWRGLVRGNCQEGLAALHADWRRLITALGEWRHRSQLLILYRSSARKH